MAKIEQVWFFSIKQHWCQNFNAQFHWTIHSMTTIFFHDTTKKDDSIVEHICLVLTLLNKRYWTRRRWPGEETLCLSQIVLFSCFSSALMIEGAKKGWTLAGGMLFNCWRIAHNMKEINPTGSGPYLLNVLTRLKISDKSCLPVLRQSEEPWSIGFHTVWSEKNIIPGEFLDPTGSLWFAFSEGVAFSPSHHFQPPHFWSPPHF